MGFLSRAWDTTTRIVAPSVIESVLPVTGFLDSFSSRNAGGYTDFQMGASRIAGGDPLPGQQWTNTPREAVAATIDTFTPDAVWDQDRGWVPDVRDWWREERDDVIGTGKLLLVGLGLALAVSK